MTEHRCCPWSHALEDLYRRARCRALEVEGVGWLALRVLGETCLDYAPDEQVEPVRLVEGPWRILVAPDLDDEQLTMAIARAIAFWWLAIGVTRAPDPGDVAALAGAIAVPLEKLEIQLDLRGEDCEELAAVFVVPTDVMGERLRALSPRHRSGLRHRVHEAS